MPFNQAIREERHEWSHMIAALAQQAKTSF
jgi:hypothetical protein